jgi:nicotinamidase-related amidase
MHKKAFTPENSAMVLIDHQIGTMSWTHSHDINLVKKNTLKLAKIAKALDLPVVLTSSMEDRVDFTGPLMPELEQILPEAFAARIKRPGIVNAMHHQGFNHAVKATGRKKLFVAGVTTEICVTFPVLQMLEEGYEVQVSADASASWSQSGDDLALRRMENAGAVITTVYQIVSELALDWTSPNGKKLEAILEYG